MAELKTNFECIYEYLASNAQNFPQLEVLSALLKDKKIYIEPDTSSNMYEAVPSEYQDGGYSMIFNPVKPYYFDIQIVFMLAVYEDNAERNLLQIRKIQNAIDWLIEQSQTDNLPEFERLNCYMFEVLTPNPSLRLTYEDDSDQSKAISEYGISVRFYVENPAKKVIKVVK